MSDIPPAGPSCRSSFKQSAGLCIGGLMAGHSGIAHGAFAGIMARMSAYTCKEVKWEQTLNSKLDLSPSEYSWDAAPPPADIAMPGATPPV